MNMKRAVLVGLLLVTSWVSVAKAQYIGAGVGAVFSGGLQEEPQQVPGGGPARADFSNSGILTVDAGLPVVPLVGIGMHYSFSRPEVSLRRGDVLGSSAVADIHNHTLTFDGRLRIPEVAGYRLYGLLGLGFARFDLDVKRQVEIPFPDGAPDRVTSFVFTYGAGIEKSLSPLVRWKFELRDYATSVSEDLYRPGGTFHRVALVVGLVLGR